MTSTNSRYVATRWVTAAGVLVSGAIHLKLWVDGFRDIAVIGPSFLLNAVAALAIAVLLVAWWHWVPAFLAAGFGAATLVAFVLSATVGLYGVHETWTGTYQVSAAVSEVVAALGGAVLLRPTLRVRSSAGARAGRRAAAPRPR